MLSNLTRPAVEYLKNVSEKETKSGFDRSMHAFVSSYRKIRAFVRSSDSAPISKTYLLCKNIERTITGNRLKFVTLDDMLACTNDWIRSFPEAYDVIVGIPRSGLLVANIIASKLGKPLTTPDGFVEGRVWMTKRSAYEGRKQNQKILLVDDRVSKGRELRSILAMLQEQSEEFQITKASLFVTNEAASLVNLYYKIIPDPVLFEWNLLHSKQGILATDMDGVLCDDPPKGLDANEAAYVEWMRNAKPYLIPLYEIDAIISSRLERYRAETENWLAKHRVPYKQLILWNLSSLDERRGNFAKYKSEVLMRVKPDLYWESNINEAKQIHQSTRLPILCTEQMTLLS